MTESGSSRRVGRNRSPEPREHTAPAQRIRCGARFRFSAWAATSKTVSASCRDGNALMSQYIGTLESTGDAGSLSRFAGEMDRYERCRAACRRSRSASAIVRPRRLRRALVCEPSACSIIMRTSPRAWLKMAIRRPVIGIAFDGTGYGLDGAIWGGEAMIADYQDFRRVSHLQYLPLAGGDAAIRHPARIAAAFMFALFGSKCRRSSIEARRRRTRTHSRDDGRSRHQHGSDFQLWPAVRCGCGAAWCAERNHLRSASRDRTGNAGAQRNSANHIYPFSIRDGAVQTGDILAAVIAIWKAECRRRRSRGRFTTRWRKSRREWPWTRAQRAASTSWR